MLDFILPWPPSVNHYYVPSHNKKTGKVRIRKNGRATKYRDDVYNTIRKQNPFIGPIYLHAIANPPSNQRFDLDNLLKGVCDALEYATVYNNDSQIDRIIIERGEQVKFGEIITRVGRLETKILRL